MAELNGVGADLGQVTALGLTNYGHYTSMRVDDQRVRGLLLHLERLMRESRDGHVTTAPVTLGQLADVDAVFVTNAAIGIRPVSAIDGIQWPDEHPVLDILCQEYARVPAELL